MKIDERKALNTQKTQSEKVYQTKSEVSSKAAKKSSAVGEDGVALEGQDQLRVLAMTPTAEETSRVERLTQRKREEMARRKTDRAEASKRAAKAASEEAATEEKKSGTRRAATKKSEGAEGEKKPARKAPAKKAAKKDEEIVETAPSGSDAPPSEPAS